MTETTAIGYNGAHMRVRRLRGPASRYQCPCGKPAQQWSYDHADPDQQTQTKTIGGVTGTYAYSLDPAHYVPLCIRCHKAADLTRLGKVPRCGTLSGYSAHGRRREPACRSCKDAYTAYSRQRRAR